jgi:cell division protein FtsN
MQNYSRQQGSTVLGIIVGLLVGLAIALAVALVITKTPVPFVSKVTKQEKTPGNGAGQIADPNKPLYGNKASAKEAIKEFPKETASSDPIAEIANKKMGIKADTRVAAVDPSPAPKKAAETKLSDTGKDAARIGSAEEKWSYYLQAGAFRNQTDAENTRAKLALMGVEARVTERRSENDILYRVRVGPFAQLEPMNRIRGKLTDNGVDVAVVRISK